MKRTPHAQYLLQAGQIAGLSIIGRLCFSRPRPLDSDDVSQRSRPGQGRSAKWLQSLAALAGRLDHQLQSFTVFAVPDSGEQRRRRSEISKGVSGTSP
jgi:hypothetical protein